MVPGYKDLLEQQENGDRNPRVTAVMVGSAARQVSTWEGLDSWFPFDFLNLLDRSRLHFSHHRLPRLAVECCWAQVAQRQAMVSVQAAGGEMRGRESA